METHDNDGRDSAGEDPWRLVSERFSALGKKFKEHYQQPTAEPADDELKQALRTLGDALDRAFSAVGSALRDPEVRDRAKDAAAALVSAFGNTFADVGDEIGKSIRRESPETGPTDEPRPSN